MTKRILCIDGGGVKGVAICAFLDYLDIFLSNYDSSLFDFFDMFVGTSTGSLIVSAIVYNKMSGRDLINKLYVKENIKKIMDGSEFTKDCRVLIQEPKYDGIGKTEILEKYLHDTLLKDSNGKDVVITAMDVSSNIDGSKKPVLFKSWENDAEFYKVKDICNASSAAPIYFPAVKIKKYSDTLMPSSYVEIGTQIMTCIDGGLFANNPTICGYAEAIKRYGAKEDIRILSIGTGIFYNDCDIGLNWGAEQWITKGDMLGLVLAGPQEIADDNMKEFTKALGHKYIRINGHLINSSLDDTSDENIENLRKTGVNWWIQNGDEVIDTLCKDENEAIYKKFMRRVLGFFGSGGSSVVI
jgi:hypothetical protein